MAIVLGPNQYGKAENRVVRVFRDSGLLAAEAVTLERAERFGVRVIPSGAEAVAESAAAADAILPKAQGDAVVWFAYPKGTSKRYKCEFNRDTGWAPMGAAGSTHRGEDAPGVR